MGVTLMKVFFVFAAALGGLAVTGLVLPSTSAESSPTTSVAAGCSCCTDCDHCACDDSCLCSAGGECTCGCPCCSDGGCCEGGTCSVEAATVAADTDAGCCEGGCILDLSGAIPDQT